MAHEIDKVLAAVQGAVWAMHPDKLREIEAFIQMRAAGWTDADNQAARDLASDAFSPRAGVEMFRDQEGRNIDVDGIRYVKLFGVIAPRMNLLSSFSGGTSMEAFMQQLRVAEADQSVRTILVHVDSPGGEAGLIAEGAELMRAVRGKKRTVIASENIMASASFWLGTSGTKAFATRGTEVGSVGVYTVHSEISKMRAEAGITDTVIRDGDRKGLVNRFEPLSKAAREQVQKRVSDTYQLFVRDLVLNRNVSPQFVLDRFGQGDVYLAEEAVDRQMIDAVFSLDEVIDRERRRNANRTTVPMNGGRTMTISDRVKAALFANGHIDSMDASDGECLAYYRGLCHARGLKLEEQDENALVELAQAKTEKSVGIDSAGREYVASVVEPAQLQQGEPLIGRDDIRNAALAEERARRAEIRAAGATLGISDTEIMQAHDDGISVEDARKKFKDLAAQQAPPVGIVGGDASQDKFAVGVTAALLQRSGYADLVDADERSYGHTLRNATLLRVAEASLQMAGIRPTGDPRMDAKAFLKIGTLGSEKIQLETGLDGGVQKLFAADDTSVNRRGDHPDALSNMMGKMLDAGYAQAPQTFQVYTRSLPDLPNFKPASFLETAVFQELDFMDEDTKHEQLKFESQMRAWIKVDRFGNKVGLTIEQVVDDDIGVFAQQLETLASAAGDTIDNSCRSLLVSNPVMLDDVVLFHSSRGNIVSSGGVPSATQAKEHRRLHRLIKGFGSTRPQNRPPVTALCPAALEEDALQTFTFFGDPKVAQTDSTINTHRGTVRPTIDSMLDGHSDSEWYTFADPRLAPIAKAHLRGSGGERGTRTTWADPDTGTRYVALDMTLGVAPFNARGSVKNPGA